jgi:hypothetical protein
MLVSSSYGKWWSGVTEDHLRDPWNTADGVGGTSAGLGSGSLSLAEASGARRDATQREGEEELMVWIQSCKGVQLYFKVLRCSSFWEAGAGVVVKLNFA